MYDISLEVWNGELQQKFVEKVHRGTSWHKSLSAVADLYFREHTKGLVLDMVDAFERTYEEDFGDTTVYHDILDVSMFLLTCTESETDHCVFTFDRVPE